MIPIKEKLQDTSKLIESIYNDQSHEQRIERFKGQYIGSQCVYDIYLDIILLIQHFRDNHNLVPYFISPTYNNLPHGISGYELVKKTMRKYRGTLLRKHVGRYYHRFPHKSIKMICVPEYGRGNSGNAPWHMHGILLMTPDIARRIMADFDQKEINIGFRKVSDIHQEFHIRTDTTPEHIDQMVSYMLKKVAGLPQHLTEELPLMCG